MQLWVVKCFPSSSQQDLALVIVYSIALNLSLGRFHHIYRNHQVNQNVWNPKNVKCRTFWVNTSICQRTKQVGVFYSRYNTVTGLDSFRLPIQNQYKPQVTTVFYRTKMTISLNMVLVSGRQQGSPVRSQFERCKGAEWDRVGRNAIIRSSVSRSGVEVWKFHIIVTPFIMVYYKNLENSDVICLLTVC